MVNVFFSYSHKDEELRNELEEHLALLKRQGIITTWHDRRITAGKDFGEEIDENLESANLILLLVSASFLASNYCYEKEIGRALEKHEDGNAVVIPVILHPCDWHSSPFGNLLATPTDGKPISMHANQHLALSVVAGDVRKVAEQLQAKPANQSMSGADETAAKHVPLRTQPRSSNLRIRRSYDEHEKDQFLEDSYEYIVRYFSCSLEEIAARIQQIKTRLKRTSDTSFIAAVYENGKKIACCSIWHGGAGFGSNSIYYSSSETTERNSYNESMHVVDDGYSMHLKPLGMQMNSGGLGEALSQEGAAEYLWSMLIRPLQE